MAKKLRKMLALVLALSIVAGQIALPALADEGAEPEVVVTVIENGTQTVTTSTDPDTGETITTTQTVTSVTDENGTKTDTTITETDKTFEYNEIYENENTTITQREETSTEEIPGSETPDEDGYVSQGGEKVTHTEFTETEEVKDYNNGPEYPMYESERTEGQETTTVTNTEVKTGTEDGGTTTTTTDNDYQTVEDITGEYVADPNGEQEPDTYTDADITQDPGDVTLSMTQKKKTDTKTVHLDVAQAVKDNIEIPAAGKTVTENADGSTTETEVTYIYDEQDKDLVIGYTVTKTIITREITEDKEYDRGQSTQTGSETKDLEDQVKTEEIFTLPERPEESTSTDADGNTVTVTVEDVLDDEGKVIGYKSTTEVTTPEGNPVSVSSETIYGTKTTTTTTTETTQNTVTTQTELTKDRVTTTQYARFYDSEGYELVVLNGEWVYKATLGSVRENKDNGHGDTDITPLTPTSVVLNGKTYVVNRPDSSIKPVSSHSTDGYDYTYTGVRGEGSQYHEVRTSNGTSQAHMFEMKVDGQTFYVYCVDYATTATPNYNYTMENVADATYYDEEASRHIEAIGRYGYWGTTGNGTGSLAKMKENLTAARKKAEAEGKDFYLTQSQINNMTEGEALTATQAAFWKYGNSGSTKISDTQANATITGIYKWLINLEPSETESTEFIDKEDFAQSASITVKDKIQDATSTAPAVYNTDIAFSLAVQPDQKSDDLLVHVIVNGIIVETRRLAGDDSETGHGTIKPDENGNYKIENVKLASGVNLTLNLSGTQHIDEGVYIYTSEKIGNTPSQTMVGLAMGERTVDLSVDMSFSVTEPKAQVKDPGAQPAQYRTDILKERKIDIETQTAVTCDVTVTTVITEETGRAWDSFWEKEYEYEYDPVPYDDDGGDETKPEDETEDERVYVTDAPKTGDVTMLLAALSGLSAGGMLLLNKKREEDEE